MEIIVFEEGLAKSFTSLEMVNLVELGEKIIQSPEDYVFVLSPDEWNEWLKLNLGIGKTLLATRTNEEMWEKLSEFAKEHEANPLSLISIVSAHPETGNTYKLGSLTPTALGDCYAIFFVKQEQAMERSEEVMRKVFRFREEQANKPPLS